MSVQDEYGRHAYELERDEEGNLKTEEHAAGAGSSDEVVQGETLLPVDSALPVDSEEERTEAYGEAVSTDSGEPLPPDTYGEDAVVEEAVVEEAVVEDAVVEEVHPEDVVAEPAPETYDTVLAADDVVADPGTGETAAADEPSWQELKGLFVDDPAGAVAGAAGKVDAVVAALRDQGESDTENLRLAFRRYQDIFRSLTEG